MKIKKDDLVIVTTGKDKGKTGKVLKTFADSNHVIVEGMNEKTKFKKKSQQGPGSMTKINAKIDASNVALIDPETKKATRIRVEKDSKGNKQRVSVKSNKVIK
ncbi:50S ribosomal protein L24 [bacterium]|jgi:large subunit ribosomal protein L24|nr:50S ribosomal protein L24 [bacterium]MBT6293615.1 50S ribosomal protein L24 [bacterium]